MDKQIVVYNGADDVRLEVQTDGETVWLTQAQMCRLFGRTHPVIARGYRVMMSLTGSDPSI